MTGEIADFDRILRRKNLGCFRFVSFSSPGTSVLFGSKIGSHREISVRNEVGSLTHHAATQGTT